MNSNIEQAIKLHLDGNFEEAKRIYLDILDKNPDNQNATEMLGVLNLQQKNFDEALSLIDTAISISPNQNLYSNKGSVYIELNRFDMALECFKKVLEFDPNSYETYNNIGNILTHKKQYKDAILHYIKAINLKPDYAKAYYNLGNALSEYSMKNEAIEAYKKAIEFDTSYKEAYFNLGNEFFAKQNFLDALYCFNKTIELDSNFIDAYNSIGVLYKEDCKPEIAIEYYNKALAIDSNSYLAYWNKALSLLLLNDYTQGFKLYEYRWQNKYLNLININTNKPLWQGNENLKGKTILLHFEQGYGDTIQFCRYIPLVTELGAIVIVKIQKQLYNLIKQFDCISELIVKDDDKIECDYQIPLMSLAYAFKTTASSVPFSNGYLKANSKKVDIFKQELLKYSGIKIGIAWSGKAGHKNDHNRSIALDKFLQIILPEFNYFCLQKNINETDEEIIKNSSNIFYLLDDFCDFNDTAALCENMDLIITVDTSIAHLAGALGKKTYLLLPYAPDWRWGLSSNKSVWYDSITIFRQDEARNWDAVFSHIVKQLKIEFN